MYIAIEGIDTVGKTTQIDLLKNKFSDAVVTKEPGGSNLGKTIRSLVLGENDFSVRAEFLLFLADRAEHVEKVIKPNLEKLIISDRSVVSGVAYADTSIDYQSILNLNKFSIDNTLPDLVVLIEIDKETLSSRLGEKDHDNIEARGVDFLLDIQSRLEKATLDLGIRLVKIDARESIEDIHQKIVKEIS
ncbi:MAG: dTMP kinase [Campylobacterales bacterium]|nr:dTMP kinase [Campylobacterales bacterium]